MGKSYSKLTPRIVNTFFVIALQQYFMLHGEYKWDPRDNKTQIDITPDFVEDDNMQKGLPQIIVQNGPVSYIPAGIGTGYVQTFPRRTFEEGKLVTKEGLWDTEYQLMVQSSTQISIFATSKDDADELGFEIAMFLMMLKPKVAEIIQIQNLDNAQQSPAQLVSQSGWTGKYRSDIVIPYTFTLVRRWEPTDQGVLLRCIATELKNVEGGNPDDPTSDGVDDNTVELRFSTGRLEAEEPACPCPPSSQV